MFVRPKTLRSWGSSACAVACFCLLPCAFGASAQSPDNSGVNKTQHTTAENQSGHASDREITAKIRRSVVSDKSLSTYGHNVKIITRGGAVTLKGPVHSDQEKQTIEDKAAAVVGKENISDQLAVKQ